MRLMSEIALFACVTHTTMTPAPHVESLLEAAGELREF